jgi:hypothetical protein
VIGIRARTVGKPGLRIDCRQRGFEVAVGGSGIACGAAILLPFEQSGLFLFSTGFKLLAAALQHVTRRDASQY